jgi:hypothetical protein
VVAGTSAGAAVMSRRVFRNAPDVLAVMKGRLREGREPLEPHAQPRLDRASTACPLTVAADRTHASAIFREILEDGAIIQAMAQRLEGQGDDVLGLAFSDPQARDDPDPSLGFEWWLRADASTHGFRAADGRP